MVGKELEDKTRYMEMVDAEQPMLIKSFVGHCPLLQHTARVKYSQSIG